MTIDQLREVHRAEPFQPFKLQLANGDEVSVPHPEFLWYPPRASRTIYVAVSDESAKVIDLLLVASIGVGNGKPSERRKPT